jgi:hypothetical protein
VSIHENSHTVVNRITIFSASHTAAPDSPAALLLPGDLQNKFTYVTYVTEEKTNLVAMGTCYFAACTWAEESVL